jgi:DNA uptake protein ComE-like DNA-binding protein
MNRTREATLVARLPYRRKRGRHGHALVVAVMVLTVLTAAAVALSAGARLEVRAARRGVDQVQLEAAMRGAVNRGIALLENARSDPENLLSVLREHRELRWMPFTPEADPNQPGIQMAVQLLDATARVNINTASPEQLEKLPGMDRDAAEAIVSWRDEESRDRYDQGSRPYEPKRRPFDTIEELLLVHDVERAQFFGSGNLQEVAARRMPPVSEWLTTWSGENNADAGGNARVDVNSAGADELLEAANRYESAVTAEQVQTLVQKRDQRQVAGPNSSSGQSQDFQSVAEALREAGVEEAKWGPVLDAWTADSRTFLPGRTNVNTASPAVLATLEGMTAELAAQLVRKRETKPDGLNWTDLLDLLASTTPETGEGGTPPEQQPEQTQGLDQLERLFCLRSSVYLVRVLVREVGSHRTTAAMALIQLPVSPEDGARIVQWREPDRFPGWSAWYRPLSDDERGGRGR